ncbi:MAG: hypothetical protein KY455_10865 [Euryarchaeota archaeon]|nr:hypothetical protein [Euryarchaeota archaeon]
MMVLVVRLRVVVLFLMLPVLLAGSLGGSVSSEAPTGLPTGPHEALSLAVVAAGLPLEGVIGRADPGPPSVDLESAYGRLATLVGAEREPVWDGLDGDLERGLVILLDAMHHAVSLQQGAVAAMDLVSAEAVAEAYRTWRHDGMREGLLSAWGDGLPGLDRTAVAAAAWTLLDAGLRAAPHLERAVDEATAPFLGVAFAASCLQADFILLLCSTGDDTLEGDHLLQVDLGGDDLHLGNSGGSGLPLLWPTANGLPAAVSLDLSGADVYRAAGSAIGVGSTTPGVLIDLLGDDHYEATDRFFTFTQGAGNLGGVGVLFDADGSDAYVVAEGRDANGDTAWDSQGFGILGGIGLLIDTLGNDGYLGGTMSMGVGDFDAVGMLVDTSGRDDYSAVRWSQGFGDGGGLGLLLDSIGDDDYTLSGPGDLDGLQGQGAGLGGLGALVDGAGIDRYTASGQAQGWGTGGKAFKPVDDLLVLLGLPHPGAGLLVDLGGPDSYSGPGGDSQAWTQGTGVGVDV